MAEKGHGPLMLHSAGLTNKRDRFYDVLLCTQLANGFACPALAIIVRCIARLRLHRRVARGELGMERPRQGPPYDVLVNSPAPRGSGGA